VSLVPTHPTHRGANGAPPDPARSSGGKRRPPGPPLILRGGKPRPPGPPQGVEGYLDAAEAVLAGHAPLPRDGEDLVFEEPWQGRALGMGVVAVERSGAVVVA
jgi:hypothetical protein